MEDDDAEVHTVSEGLEILEDSLQDLHRCHLVVTGVEALAVVEGRKEEADRLRHPVVGGRPHRRSLDQVPSEEVV